MPVKTVTYPRPGTNAERVLAFILDHPNTPTNSIITQLDMNPSVVRKCLTGLVANKRIEDNPQDGNHAWSAVGKLL